MNKAKQLGPSLVFPGNVTHEAISGASNGDEAHNSPNTVCKEPGGLISPHYPAEKRQQTVFGGL